MQKIFIVSISFIISVISSLIFATNSKPTLVFDSTAQTQQASQMPKNFRSTNESFTNPKLNTESLKQLHMIGSGAFTVAELQKIIHQIPGKITIVDLRQESHGFVNGLPVSWYGKHDQENLGKTNNAVKQDEINLLNQLAQQKNIAIHEIITKKSGNIIQSKPITITVEQVATEEQIAKQNHLGYERFYVTDHMPPRAEEVDRFVKFVKSLPNDQWLYFHCHAGVGRTTTFMLMYEIMRNAKKLPLDVLIQRQYLLGGKDLAELPKRSSYKYTDAAARKTFIKKFYDYVKTNQDNFQTSWSAY